MKKKNQKRKKWIRFRHKIVWAIVYPILSLYSKFHYGFSAVKFQGATERPYLILMNHQTAFDQFFVKMIFKKPVYFVATEDLFSNGFISSFIRFCIAPIPIKKSTTDVRAVLNCRQVGAEGGTIAIAPEGNRTYSGRTGYIKPSIAGLIRVLKMPVAFVKIEGGYGVEPRWARSGRGGKTTARVSRVLELCDYESLTDEEIYKIVCDELYVDENAPTGLYPSKKSAEGAERCLFVCPECGLTTFHTKGQLITCQKCKKSVRYLDTKEIVGENGEFPFTYFGQWYDAQEAFVRSLDLSAYIDSPMYRDTARFSEVIPYKKKRPISLHAEISLFGDRLEIDGTKYPFSEIRAMSVLGKNKLNFYHGDKIYQFKGDFSFNALKYMNIYFHFKNGGLENEFLGL